MYSLLSFKILEEKDSIANSILLAGAILDNTMQISSLDEDGQKGMSSTLIGGYNTMQSFLFHLLIHSFRVDDEFVKTILLKSFSFMIYFFGQKTKELYIMARGIWNEFIRIMDIMH